MQPTLACAQLAAERAAAKVHADLARGLTGLATVAATAPFLSVFLTLNGIAGAFCCASGEKTAIMAALARRLSEALVPVVAGVLLALLASAGRQLLLAQLGVFDMEMKTLAPAILESCVLPSSSSRS